MSGRSQLRPGAAGLMGTGGRAVERCRTEAARRDCAQAGLGSRAHGNVTWGGQCHLISLGCSLSICVVCPESGRPSSLPGGEDWEDSFQAKGLAACLAWGEGFAGTGCEGGDGRFGV